MIYTDVIEVAGFLLDISIYELERLAEIKHNNKNITREELLNMMDKTEKYISPYDRSLRKIQDNIPLIEISSIDTVHLSDEEAIKLALETFSESIKRILEVD